MVSNIYTGLTSFLNLFQRFGEICYFYDDEQMGPSFHIRWFTHGSQTILRDTAHPLVLFPMQRSCDNLLLTSIYQKCHIQHLFAGQEPPIPDGSSKIHNDFYLRSAIANASYISAHTNYSSLSFQSLAIRPGLKITVPLWTSQLMRLRQLLLFVIHTSLAYPVDRYCYRNRLLKFNSLLACSLSLVQSIM